MKEREKYSKALGKRIRAFRESKNISIKEFESLENSIDRHALSRIENGRVTPSIYTLYKICQALKITQTELLNGFESEFKR